MTTVRAADSTLLESPARPDGAVPSPGSSPSAARLDPPRSGFRWALDPHPGRDVGFPLGPFRAGEMDPREIPAGAPVAIGAAADPYPPIERRTGRTRSALEALGEAEGFDITLTTRSDLVTRDRDLLADLAGRHRLGVEMILPALDRALTRALDPEGPRPDVRLKAISELAAAGVPVGIVCAPVLPAVNDRLEAVDRLAERAARSGADWLKARACFLPPGSMVSRFPRLERERPDLVDRVRMLYARSARLPEEYRAGVEELVAWIRGRRGLRAGRSESEPDRREAEGDQLPLL